MYRRSLVRPGLGPPGAEVLVGAVPAVFGGVEQHHLQPRLSAFDGSRAGRGKLFRFVSCRLVWFGLVWFGFLSFLVVWFAVSPQAGGRDHRLSVSVNTLELLSGAHCLVVLLTRDNVVR